MRQMTDRWMVCDDDDDENYDDFHCAVMEPVICNMQEIESIIQP